MTTAGYHGTSWILRTLPFIEGNTTFKNWQFTYPVANATNAVNGYTNGGLANGLANMDQKGFYCPTRRSQVRPGIDTPLLLVTGTSGWTAGGTDYGGCVGRHMAFLVAAPHKMQIPNPGASPSTLNIAPYIPGVTVVNTAYVVQGDNGTVAYAEKALGILGQVNQSVSFGQIRDGTSNTIMVGELQRITTIVTVAPFNASSGPYYSHDGWAVGGDATLFTTGYMGNGTSSGGATLMNNGCFPSPGSEHSNGANFGLGDGSVRYLNTSMDSNIFCLMGSMADKVAVSPPD